MNKEAWKAAKADVEAIEKERAALLAPTEERYKAATERLELIEEDCPDIVARCEGCMEPIWEGDRYAYDDESCVHTCEACAPTWRDMLDNPDHFHDRDGEPMTAEKARTACDAHVARGGSLDDKMVSS